MANGPFLPVRSEASQQKQIAFAQDLVSRNRSRITGLEQQVANLRTPFSPRARKSIMEFMDASSLFRTNRRATEASRSGASFDPAQAEANRQLQLRAMKNTLLESARAARVPSALQSAGVGAGIQAAALQSAGQQAQLTSTAPVPAGVPGNLEVALGKLLQLGQMAASVVGPASGGSSRTTK